MQSGLGIHILMHTIQDGGITLTLGGQTPDLQVEAKLNPLRCLRHSNFLSPNLSGLRRAKSFHTTTNNSLVGGQVHPLVVLPQVIPR